jgi:hypothetical protein
MLSALEGQYPPASRWLTLSVFPKLDEATLHGNRFCALALCLKTTALIFTSVSIAASKRTKSMSGLPG